MIYTILIFAIIAILFFLKAASLWMRHDTNKRRIKPNYVANNKPSADSLLTATDKMLDDIDKQLNILSSFPSPPLPPFTSITKFTLPNPFPIQGTIVGSGGGGSGGFHTTTQQTFTYGMGQPIPNYSHKRTILLTLLELQVPKSTWIRHYILGDKAKDDPEWKKDFLEFCAKNDVDVCEEDLDKGELLI